MSRMMKLISLLCVFSIASAFQIGVEIINLLQNFQATENAEELLLVAAAPLLIRNNNFQKQYHPEVYYSDDLFLQQQDTPTPLGSRQRRPTISLTPEEQKLFSLLQTVRNTYSPRTTIRVAGGWVRDKLLFGTSNADIDLVISDKSGVEFAALVSSYLQTANTTQEGLDGYDNIQITSDKGESSQHLQTATLSLWNFDVDFARLRYERYDRDSRIPSRTGVASVVEDAWRRDLTINALYYNLNTQQLEDWTEQGWQDLTQWRQIATPRSSLPTLLEDPIRILRAIRFAATLSFGMNAELIQAARQEQVKVALQKKVSRDAIGAEVDGMMSTRDPTRGIKLLLETNLINVIFPLDAESINDDDSDHDPYYSSLKRLHRTQALVSRIFTSEWDASKRRYLWYAAFLQPVYGTTAIGNNHNSKREKRDGSNFYQLLAHDLKRPKKDLQSIECILKGAEIIRVLLLNLSHEPSVRAVMNGSGLDEDEEKLSDLKWLWYKALKPIGPSLWKEAFLLALACNYEYDNFNGIAKSVNQYHEWMYFLEHRLQLEGGVTCAPLLNGSEIQQYLGGVKGEGFRQVLTAQEEFQVRNPGCSKERAAQYLQAKFPQYVKSRECI